MTDWLTAETDNLVAAVRAAHDANRPHAWLLADALREYFFAHRQPREWLTVAHLGLETANAHGDVAAQAAASLCAAQANRCVGRYDVAREHGTRAAELASRIPWPECEAVALNELAIVHFEQGRLADGTVPLERAIEVIRSTGSREVEAGFLVNLGVVRRQLGDIRRAAELLERCLAVFEQLGEAGSPLRKGTVLCNLGETYRLLGQFDRARRRLSDALRIQQEIGHDSGRIVTAANLAMLECEQGTGSGYVRTEGQIATARARLRLGDVGPAVDAAREALESARSAGHRLLQGQAATVLAHAYLDAGRTAAAKENAEAALRIHRQTGHLPGETATRDLLARIARA